MKKKPNIIILNPDEMRWDTMGHMGDPAACTPFLDQLAEKEAVSFSRAYCQNPVCVPSRSSFLTGLYPHTKGHRTMGYMLHPEERTLFQELKDAGYHVWMNARNDFAAAQYPGWFESHADEIFYGDDKKQAPGSEENKKKDSGSEKTPEKKPDPFFQGMTEEMITFSHFGGHDGTEADQDMEDTLAAVRRIKTPIEGDKPLCLFLGWNNPHPTYKVAERLYEMIDPEKIPERVKIEDCKDKALILYRLHELVGLDSLTEDQWKELRRVYLAQCTHVDDMLRKVCDALKEAGMYDDSAIFIFSDHGDFAGDYGLPEKAQNLFDDCLVRVPLLIKPPKDTACDAGITDSLAELVDFYATALDYAGVEGSYVHFGRSLRTVVENRENTVRDYVCCEGGRLPGEWQADEYHSGGPDTEPVRSAYWPKMKAQSDPLYHEKGTMIFDGKYKYVERPSGRNELYDMTSEEKDKVNLYPEMQDDPVVFTMQKRLLNWYQLTCDMLPRAMDRRMPLEKISRFIRSSFPEDLADSILNFILEHPEWDIFTAIKLAVDNSKKENN